MKSYTKSIGLFLLVLALMVPATGIAAEIPAENLQLWLRADAGVVTDDDGVSVLVWEDQSGNGNHAVAMPGAEPVVVVNPTNSKQAVQFNSISYVRVPHKDELNAGEALTLFAVYRNQTGNRLLQKKKGTGVSEDGWFVIATRGLGVGGVYYKPSPTLFPGGRDTVYITSHVFDAAKGTIELYNSGHHVMQVTEVPAQVPNADDLFIGKREHENESQWSGDLFELIIYNVALDDEARAQVEHYLINKYVQ